MVIAEDLVVTLALALLPGIGARRFALLEGAFGDAAGAWRASRAELEEAVAAGLDPAAAAALYSARGGQALEAARGHLARARAEGIAVLARGRPGYPPLLTEIADPPPVLFVRGEVAVLSAPRAVAVVGTRRATAAGRAVARRLAAGLAQAGVTVVSGLARGIDAAAHRGALEGGGPTVAVLGCGVDVAYPPEHRELVAAAAGAGAVISEHPPGAAPLPNHFPARNRIISGLSHGLVVVEAGARSGALITADLALEQGREVMAVPGPAGAELSAGPHRLIRQGARLVEEAADVLEAMGWEAPAGAGAAWPAAGGGGGRLPAATDHPGGTLDPDARRVLACLEPVAAHADEIAGRSDLPAARVAAALGMLELSGLAWREPGGRWLRAPAGSGR